MLLQNNVETLSYSECPGVFVEDVGSQPPDGQLWDLFDLLPTSLVAAKFSVENPKPAFRPFRLFHSAIGERLGNFSAHDHS